MTMRAWYFSARIILILSLVACVEGQTRPSTGITELQCDSLKTPLGDDTPHPTLSWKLQDGRTGARQTAYRILVATRESLLLGDRSDVWDSGRVNSAETTGVVYAGPVLKPETRYFWRVKVWDQEGKPYPNSAASWWETGVLDSANWRASWIGYEDGEHAALRAARAVWVTNPAVADYKNSGETRHDLRLTFDLEKPVTSATLYATGQDTVAAWINGHQLITQTPSPAWGRLPWRNYSSAGATELLHAGKNVLAIEALLYNGGDRSQTPMNAALYVSFADGSATVFKTGEGDWKSALNTSGAWQGPEYKDASWIAPVQYPATNDAFGGPDGLGIPLQTPPVAALRKQWPVSKVVKSARLYVTALGAYKLSLNGTAVGDQVLSPGWTDFRERVTYQEFDVTGSMRQGTNALGAYLAPGWYDTPLEWVGQGNNYGATQPALKAQLRVQYVDGSVDWIVTDSSWKADDSAILSAEIYNGEFYDARRLQRGWDTASFDDKTWQPAMMVHPHEPEIVWQSFQPIRATQLIRPKAVSNPAPGVFIYDFAQNLAGVARLQVQGPAGTDVTMRFGEQLNADGTLFTANLRNAKATDHYILSGRGIEHYQPTFTFHGFRYLEVTGVPRALPVDSVTAVVLHTDVAETLKMTTGSPMLNKLWSNILWGQRSNFVGLPTDCPQRDERLGWTADAQVFWRTASYDADLAAFSRKYAADLRGTQMGTSMYGIYAPGTSKPNAGFGPGWSDAGVIVPWTSWIQTGDKTIVEQNWEGMESYLAGILKTNPDHLWKNEPGIGFGDWLAPEGNTSQLLIATAYWAYDISLMQQMAHALGRDEDEERYARLFVEIRGAFQAEFVHPGGVVGAHEAAEKSGGVSLLETQTSYVLALHMNLLREEDRAAAAKRLVDRIGANGGRLATGFLGTPYLLEVLSDTGHSDVAYRLLLNKEYPSWGYMVEHGATTMWERWNADQMRDQPGMNSYNHYAYGAVAEWIYRYAAGIDTTATAPGFRIVDLHPNFDERLGSIDVSYDSPYGTIHSSWTTSAGATKWDVTIPANATGRLALPEAKVKQYGVDGHSLDRSDFKRTVDDKNGQIVFAIPAGRYGFVVQAPR